MKQQFGFTAVALMMFLALCYSRAYGEAPYVNAAPQFAKAGQSVSIGAYASGAESVVLSWKAAKGSGKTAMSYDPADGQWKGEIPGKVVGGATSLQYRVTSRRGENAEESPDYTLFVSSKFTTLTPQPIKLIEKVVVSKRWDSGPDAFGCYKEQGGNAGPASIAYNKGVIYLLDNVNGRILGFDKDGKVISSVALPAKDMTDLIADPSSSLILTLNQYRGDIYKVVGETATRLQTIRHLRYFTYPAKFVYSGASRTLYVQDAVTNKLIPVMRNGVAVSPQSMKAVLSIVPEVSGKNMILGLNGGKDVLSIPFDKNITGVEEVVVDSQGIIWVLYTLDGDYRMRRLARVDASKGTVGVAEAAGVWFKFDATRHMAATENGVVLFASDPQEGRIVSYDFQGGNL